MENLKYTLDQVNYWIKAADQKALILGSFNVAGFIYQLLTLDTFKDGGTLSIILRSLSIILGIVATFFWLRIIYPKLDNKHKTSKIYFQHIANAYGEDVSRGVEELQNFDEKKIREDLASQIVINSIIAKKKYADIQRFIWVFGAQFIVLVSLLIASL